LYFAAVVQVAVQPQSLPTSPTPGELVTIVEIPELRLRFAVVL
jgi:hypothetical protein